MELTKYEEARIVGARALQVSMGAPLLIDRGKELSPIEIAKNELKDEKLPITVRKVMPEKVEIV